MQFRISTSQLHLDVLKMTVPEHVQKISEVTKVHKRLKHCDHLRLRVLPEFRQNLRNSAVP